MRLCLVTTLVACQLACGATRRWECGEEGVNANVSGEWLLRADGELEDCPEGAPEGDVFLDVDVSFRVEQSDGAGGPATLFLERAVVVDGGSLSFDGEVDGDCVDFTIHETGPGYDLTYVFEGDIDGTEIDGDFEASGSVFGACVGKGGFEVTVLVPFEPHDGSPGDDGGPPDDGGPNDGDLVPGDGDVVPGDGDVDPGDPRTTYECYQTEDCEEGACVDHRCVPVCDSASDCRVGEKCESRRCVDASTGCNCGTGPGGAAALLLLVFLVRRRARE
jgi:uncharacterized protein (TIGR03382 family)